MSDFSNISQEARSLAERVGSVLETAANQLNGRLLLASITLVIGLSTYQYLNRTLVPRVDLYTPLDEAIPFLPWTILVYLSMYVMFVAAAIVVRGRAFLRGLSALIIVNVLSFIGFILFTSHYPRPAPSSIEVEWLARLFTWMFGLDPPGNTFPSLHVGTTVTAAAMLWNKPGRWIWVTWAALICVSTLTVKQHFVADVVGGLLVAAVTFLWIDRRAGAHSGVMGPTPP